MQKRRWTKVLILLLVGVLALSAAGVAVAQSSQSYELGCWSVLTSVGGTRTSTNFQINETFGQLAPGRSTSPSYTLNAGFQQDWRTLTPDNPAPPVIGPDDSAIYIPLIQLTVRVTRTCMW
jgi:hypothetical protein